MAKAILELSKMPKSCRECPFYKITDICDVLSAWNNYMPVLVPSEGKHPDQVDYLPEKREIRINLPEEVWRNIDTVIMTRQFQEELVVEKQKESEGKEG